jgi:hypothetical protein
MRKLGVLVASGLTVGSMLLASPAAWANDYRHRDNDRYRRAGYSYDRHFTLGVKVVDTDADDRGRRGPSRGDRWSVAFNLVDGRNRVGNGVADCVVTSIQHRDWRTSKSRCDVTFRLPDGVTFVHVAEHDDDNPLPRVAAFQRFQEGIRERCEGPPEATPLQEIGSFRFFGDAS